MSASIDGQPWQADSVIVVRDSSGLYSVFGYRFGPTRSEIRDYVAVAVSPAGGTAPCPCGGTIALRNAAGTDADLWFAIDPLDLARFPGRVDLTQASGTRLRGTFAYTAHWFRTLDELGSLPARREVTNGQFDVRF